MGTTLAALIATCAPLVHPTTLHALVAVESAGNPYAVSVNYPARLAARGIDLPEIRQPRTAAEAQQLVHHLHTAGYTTSVGLAQINAEHLNAWRLPLATLLDPCSNLALAQRILLDCQESPGTAPPSLPALLSCFNSGNATTGIRNGYAARVHAAALRLTQSEEPRSFTP
jgi:type IV secretion system protein VirB1